MNTDESNEQLSARSMKRRVGAIVCAIGAVQLLYGIVAAPRGTVKFEILGLIIGVLILKGSARAIAVVRWIALLSAGAILLEPIKPFVLEPAQFILVQLRLHSMELASSYVPSLLSVAMVVATAVGLSHPAVLRAQASAGQKVRSARIPLALGLAIAFVACFLEYRFLTGEEAQRASRTAAEQYGPRFQYFTNSIQFQLGTPKRVHATVQAWNENEILVIPVEWRK